MEEDIYCRMCHVKINEKNRCKSHLFPKWVIKEQKKQASNDHVLLVGKDTLNKKRPDGSYDAKILCRECDAKIGVYDESVKNILISTKPTRTTVRDNEYLILPNANLDHLQLFALSLLWRFHISAREEARGVDLGDHESTFLKAIRDNDLDAARQIQVFVYRQESTDKKINQVVRGISQISGLIESKDEASYYEIVLPRGFVFMIKVDGKNWLFPSVYDQMHENNFLILVKKTDMPSIFANMIPLIKRD